MTGEKQKFTSMDIIKYICICTVGSGVLFGPKEIRENAGNNSICVNLALFVAYIMIQFMAQGYAEIGRIEPAPGGDSFYLELFYSKIAATIYAAVMLVVSVPGITAIFVGCLLDVFKVEKYQVLIKLAMCILVAPLGYIPLSKRKLVSDIGTYFQLCALLAIGVLLPSALVFRTSCTAIDKISKVEPEPLSLSTFICALSSIYFYFCGYNEANSFSRADTGPLYKPYLLSTTVLYMIYAVIINLFLVVYKNDSSAIDFEKVLSFTKKGARPIYVFVASCLYFPPFLSMAFFSGNNRSYLTKTYGLTELHNIIIVVVGGALSFGYTFMPLGKILNAVSVVMMVVALFSLMGIFVYKRKHAGYKMKMPFGAAVASIVSSLVFIVVVLLSMFKKNNKE